MYSSLSLFFKYFHVIIPTVVILFLQDESSWKSYNVVKASMMDANYSLPDNVAIITLQVHNLFIYFSRKTIYLGPYIS